MRRENKMCYSYDLPNTISSAFVLSKSVDFQNKSVKSVRHKKYIITIWQIKLSRLRNAR